MICSSLNSRLIDIWEGTDQIVEDLPDRDETIPFKSGVNIMFGCNNFCSYCIVPYVSGRESSREPEAIVKEIETSGSGRRFRSHASWTECKLLWQDTGESGYFCTASGECWKISRDSKRIRFMTSHPKDLSDELIETMAKSKKICHHLHLPLQSGSSRILKVMNRRYDKEKYLGSGRQDPYSSTGYFPDNRYYCWFPW